MAGVRSGELFIRTFGLPRATLHYHRISAASCFLLISVAFGRTWVYFRPYRTWRRMPLLIGFGLIALFIWLAENVGTFSAAWL